MANVYVYEGFSQTKAAQTGTNFDNSLSLEYEDNFTRPNELPLNPAQWGVVPALGSFAPLQIVSDHCESSSTLTVGCEYFLLGPTGNQYAQVTVGAIGSSGADLDAAYVGVVVRFDHETASGYYCTVVGTGGSANVSLDRDLFNAATVNLGMFTGTVNAGDVLRCVAFGSQLFVEINGNEVIAATDATYASGSTGVIINELVSPGDTYVTDFQMGTALFPETPWANPGNIATNTPGTYASVTLSEGSESGGSVVFDLAGSVSTGGFVSSATVTSGFPTTDPPEPTIILISGLTSAGAQTVFTPPAGFAALAGAPSGSNGFSFLGNAGSGNLSETFNVSPNAVIRGLAMAFDTGGNALNFVQSAQATIGASSPCTVTLPNPVTAGNTLILLWQALTADGDYPELLTVSDNLSNTWAFLSRENASVSPFSSIIVAVDCAQSVAAGATTVSMTFSGGQSGKGIAWVAELSTGSLPTGPSEILQAQGFGFSIPSNSTILGVELQINGKQTDANAGDQINVTVLNPNEPLAARSGQLATTDSSFTLGGMLDGWGQDWTPAQINNPGWGFGLQALLNEDGPITYDVSGVVATVWYTPPGVEQFDWIGSYEQTDGDVFTLAIDNAGTLWQEDVFGNPGVLAPIYGALEPDTFAVACTEDDREFFALSDLQSGTDMPRGYDGTNIDRLSQVGPAAPPAISFGSTSYNVVSITQPTEQVIIGAQWNSGINSNSPGNLLTVYSNSAGFLTGVDVGSVVYLTFTSTKFAGANDLVFLITAVGQAFGMESGDGTLFYYASMAAPSTAFERDFNNGGGIGTMGLSIATLTVSQPIPNVTVGSSITLAGVSPSNWNNTWTINGLVNGATLRITQTSLTSDTATYEYSLVTGVAPTVGQLVTITGCTNGPVVAGQDIFNQFQATISSVAPGQFSIFPVNAANVPPAAETNAVAQVLPTAVTFDPGLNYVGTNTDPLFGTGSGGTVVIAGGLGSGLRQCVVMFLTRNEYLTAPSPPVVFTLPENANQIVATQLPIGPPDTIARVCAFTGANGAFFFWLPTAQSIQQSSGQVLNYTSTVVPDNTSTEATFNFTDALLLAAESIDTAGSNQFALVELGSSLGVIPYSSRLFAWGEQNKVQNFLNLSFDGGYLLTSQTTVPQPLGWTIDPTFGAGTSLVTSPLFGNALQIQNTTGSTQSIYGMITQSAYQDYNKVPILNVQTTYSIRVTASSPNLTPSGNLIIDLWSPSFSNRYGSYTIPIASLGATSTINIGTLLTTVFQTQVPADLQLRIYVTAFPNNGLVVIDRIEPFPTEQPVLSTQLRGSYENNFEAFDGVTGNLGAGVQNQQPVMNAFELFDNLYIVKSKSIFSTTDNGTTEPNFWNVRTVSQKCGTPSIHGVDVGEGWALIVGEPGLYIFVGGVPVKISPELDGNPGLWQTISWKYGYTVWIRNDTTQRKIYIGVPIPTPNQWMPNFPANANPTQPNVVLMMNYKELMTGAAIENSGPMRLAYTGELKTWGIGRKWSAWSIEACYADFIDRDDSSTPIFFCADEGVPKIYQQITGQYNDDGDAMKCQYISYGFPKTSDAQQMQLGQNELECVYLTLLIRGEGNLVPTVYPNTTDSPDAETLYSEPLLDPPPAGDMELPINQVGNRFFFGFEVREPDEWFELSKITPAIGQNPWAPVRGSN